MCEEAPQAQRRLMTGIVRRQFPSLKTTWLNYGSSKQNGSRFEHHIRILHVLSGEY